MRSAQARQSAYVDLLGCKTIQAVQLTSNRPKPIRISNMHARWEKRTYTGRSVLLSGRSNTGTLWNNSKPTCVDSHPSSATSKLTTQIEQKYGREITSPKWIPIINISFSTTYQKLLNFEQKLRIDGEWCTRGPGYVSFRFGRFWQQPRDHQISKKKDIFVVLVDWT